MDALLNWLLGADAPAGSKLDSAQMSFRGLFPLWAAIALGLACAAAAVAFYASESAKVGRFRRALGALLRTGVLVLLILLLLRPVLTLTFTGDRPRGPALLIDNTLSMTQIDERSAPADRVRVAIAEGKVAPTTPITDTAALTEPLKENPSRAKLVNAVLRNPQLKLVAGLESIGPMRSYLFGSRVRFAVEPTAGKAKADAKLNLPELLVKAMTSDETRTAAADAVVEVLNRRDGDAPTAIVLITDGRDNGSKLSLAEAAQEAARAKVPLHIYGVGAVEIGNIALKDVSVPETVFYDDTVSVTVRWRSRGFKGGTAEVVLTLGGRVVARKDVPNKDGDDLRETLTFTPTKASELKEDSELTATVRYKGVESVTDDNEVKKPVRIVDRRVKILYVESAPRWEYKYLQTALLRDRRVEARFILTDGDPQAMQAGLPFLPAFPAARRDLFDYDVLIIGDVASQYFGPERLGWLRDFVREGGSLVFVAGRRFAPSSYDGTVFAEVLPVEFAPLKFSVDPAAVRPQAYVPALTRAGERNEMLSLAETPEDNLRVWQSLPGFYWYYPVTKLRPGATALLSHPRARAGDQPMPLMASQYYGKGQVLFLGIEETWRWRFNAAEKHFARFWGQIIYRMGLPHLVGNPKRMQLALERTENVQGRPGYVYARVFDAEYRPYTADRVKGRLEHVDAKAGQERSREIMLESVPGQPGEYRALLAHDITGKFSVRIDNPTAGNIDYRVGYPPQHEQEPAGMAEDLLREAAALSGGKFYREEDLHRLVSRIERQTAPFIHRQEVLLWNGGVFALFLLLITIEWLVRKFSNMS